MNICSQVVHKCQTNVPNIDLDIFLSRDPHKCHKNVLFNISQMSQKCPSPRQIGVCHKSVLTQQIHICHKNVVPLDNSKDVPMTISNMSQGCLVPNNDTRTSLQHVTRSLLTACPVINTQTPPLCFASALLSPFIRIPRSPLAT